MSELDDVKNDAEKYAKDHPQQVKEGEQELEKKLTPDQAQGSPLTAGGQEKQAPADGRADQTHHDSAAGDSAGSQ